MLKFFVILVTFFVLSPSSFADSCDAKMKYAGTVELEMSAIGTQPPHARFDVEGALDMDVDYPESGVTLKDHRNQIGLRVNFDPSVSKIGFTYALLKHDPQSVESLTVYNSIPLNPVFPLHVIVEGEHCPRSFRFENYVLSGGVHGQKVVLSGEIKLFLSQ